MLSIKAHLARFVVHLTAKGYSSRTVHEYQLNLARLVEYLDGVGVRTLTDVTSVALVGYQTALMSSPGPDGRPLSLGTQGVRVSQVRMFFRYLVKSGFLLADPAQVLEVPRVPMRAPGAVLTVAETKRLLVVPDVTTPLGLRDRAMLELMYATGARVSEVLSLSVYDIDLVEEELTIRRGKGGKGRRIPAGPVATSWVRRYLSDGRPHLVRGRKTPELFLSRRGRRMDRVDAEAMVRKRARAARIAKRVTPHTLRRTFATHMLRGKASLRHLQEMLGHARLTSTQVYTRVEITDLKEAHRRCHPRGQA